MHSRHCLFFPFSDLLELYWSLLKLLLTNLHGPPRTAGVWDLDLLACRILLSSGTSSASSGASQLPGWLTQRFLSGEVTKAGPVVPLLRVLFENGQLREATRLATSMLSAAIGPETGQCPSFLKKVSICVSVDINKLNFCWAIGGHIVLCARLRDVVSTSWLSFYRDCVLRLRSIPAQLVQRRLLLLGHACKTSRRTYFCPHRLARGAGELEAS